MFFPTCCSSFLQSSLPCQGYLPSSSSSLEAAASESPEEDLRTQDAGTLYRPGKSDYFRGKNTATAIFSVLPSGNNVNFPCSSSGLPARNSDSIWELLETPSLRHSSCCWLRICVGNHTNKSVQRTHSSLLSGSSLWHSSRENVLAWKHVSIWCWGWGSVSKEVELQAPGPEFNP